MDKSGTERSNGAQHLQLTQEDPMIIGCNAGTMFTTHLEYLDAFFKPLKTPPEGSPDLPLLSEIVLIDFQMGQIMIALQLEEVLSKDADGAKAAYKQYADKRRELVNELHNLRTQKS